jgi:hypothetical protein
MPWIESHTELARHPKTLRLARRLGVSLPAAIGHLHLLWWWALEYAPDGNLAVFSDEEVAQACCWEGTAVSLRRALTAVGFLDDGGAVHDWDAYTARLMEQRARANEKTRLRMRAFRERQRNTQEVTPIVTRNGSSRYASTVPDRTVPTGTTPVERGHARGADAPTPPASPTSATPALPDAPDGPAPATPRGNPKVAAVIDALRAEGMTGTLKPADRQALTRTEYPAGDVASLYAAIYRGEYGDEFMHTGLSVANCVNRWMDGWQSHRAGHRAPDRRTGNGNGNGHAPDKTSALQKTLEVISDELGFDPTAGGGPTGPGTAPRGGGAAGGERGAPDPAVGGGQAGGGLRPQLPRPPDD